MRKIAKVAILSISSFLVATNTHADVPDQAVAIDYLKGPGDLEGIRAAFRPITKEFVSIPVIGDAKVYWEASINFWDGKERNNNETTYTVAVSPVLVKRITTIRNTYPLSVEFGIGVSYVHDRKFAGRDIGSNYQFEDRVGLVLGLGPKSASELAIRYMHYSNGGLNTKNPGVDFLSLAYIYNF